MIGTRFQEMICIEKQYLDRLIVLLARNNMDPLIAARKVNQALGRTVCEVHDGILTAYEERGSEQKITVKSLGATPVFITPLWVKYVDGYEGYTYRARFVILPGQKTRAMN